MIEIDGSQGEGGGQVLRTSLALAILTRQELHLTNIRAGREKPGLMPQHLKSVDAAAAVSRAEVEGAARGSTEVRFRPGELRSGRYIFDIGTAGATSLVLQTVFVPLSWAGSASTVQITGGTHVPNSPPFPFLYQNWLPFLLKMEYDATLSMDTAGFYPQGGGRISATIRPSGPTKPLNMLAPGQLLQVRGVASVANLEVNIAERMKRHALQRLSGTRFGVDIPKAGIKVERLVSPSKGAFFMLLAEFESGQAAYSALGEPGKPAERLADEVLDALLAFIQTGAAVDERLADQLLLPMAFASGPSHFTTCRLTRHLSTNTAILKAFLPVQIDLEGEPGGPGIVRITPP